MKKTILIIDDEELMLDFLEEALKEEYNILTASSGKEGLGLFKNNKVDLVISDIKLPDINGVDILYTIKETDKNINVILMTAYASVEDAVKATKLGAFEYIIKPFTVEKIIATIHKALKKETVSEKKDIKLYKLIYKSKEMQAVIDLIKKYCMEDENVLITGESGVGKELIARTIYYNSQRENKPFITVNCGAIPENLMDSELFGHEEGAFTGATKRRKGVFELADTGIVFLDEIGELNSELQVKLLRVLEEQQFRRVGGEKIIKVNVRVIAATNKDLNKEVMNKKFRKDLFYRLNVFSLNIPSLRERKQDIEILTEYFLKMYCKKYQKEEIKIQASAMEKLLNYNWPGNVRELENFIKRIVALKDNIEVDEKDIKNNLYLAKNYTESDVIEIVESMYIGNNFKYNDFIENIEKRLIGKILKETDNKHSKAAEKLGIKRTTLIEKLKRFE